MANRIAVVSLAAGQIGFHDDLSHIILTPAHPSADVYPGMNTTYLKEAVKDHKINLIWGSLTTSYVSPDVGKLAVSAHATTVPVERNKHQKAAIYKDIQIKKEEPVKKEKPVEVKKTVVKPEPVKKDTSKVSKTISSAMKEDTDGDTKDVVTEVKKEETTAAKTSTKRKK